MHPRIILIVLGQSVLVSNPCDHIITQHHADGSLTYIVPRPLDGGTIIGTTRQINDPNPNADPATREAMLLRAAQIHGPIITNGLPPDADGFEVVADIVGRRPARDGGPRIEREESDNKIVIHAYGFGGSGYQFSWGVAQEVLKLLGPV